MIFKLKVCWHRPNRNGRKTNATFKIEADNEALARLELADKLRKLYENGWTIE